MKSQTSWRVAEDAVIPVVERLFSLEDVVHGPRKAFRYRGTERYEGSGEYAGRRSRVVSIGDEQGSKRLAQLFPLAIAPIARAIGDHPERFEGDIAHGVQRALKAAGISQGDFPSFYTNESYYYAFCREYVARLQGPPPVVLDPMGTAWVRNTSVKVVELVESYQAHGWSAEEMHRQYPSLSLAAIHGAFAWYYEHRGAMDRLVLERLARAEELRASSEESPLRRRLKAQGIAT